MFFFVKNLNILWCLIEQITNRALDTEEILRYEVVQEILKAMKADNAMVNDELLNVLKERTLDIKVDIFFLNFKIIFLTLEFLL